MVNTFTTLWNKRTQMKGTLHSLQPCLTLIVALEHSFINDTLIDLSEELLKPLDIVGDPRNVWCILMFEQCSLTEYLINCGMALGNALRCT